MYFFEEIIKRNVCVLVFFFNCVFLKNISVIRGFVKLMLDDINFKSFEWWMVIVRFGYVRIVMVIS